MGGHGGLNILPQKRWNVYNFDNREKVRQDEEAAAKEEQIKQEHSRKRDFEFRLEKLRFARGGVASASEPNEAATVSEKNSNHINLFEGLKFFSSIGCGAVEEEEDGRRDSFKKMKKDLKDLKREKTAPKVVLPEDEKYRLGYGIAGKDVKTPWYLSRQSDDVEIESGGNSAVTGSGKRQEGKKSGKKTLEELREERLKREKREKGRERALVVDKAWRDGGTERFQRSKGFSR